jgi:hypothetical protein
MVWCGFDESMRSGIVEYAEGIAKAIGAKARDRQVPLPLQVEHERSELRTLERVIDERLERTRDSEAVVLQLKAFRGLVAVARFLIDRRSDLAPGTARPLDLGREAYALASLIQQFEQCYETLPQSNGHATNAGLALAMTIPVAREIPEEEPSNP